MCVLLYGLLQEKLKKIERKNNVEDKINPKETTGGIKHDLGKLRFDLFPMMPLLALAKLFTIGKEKYGTRNWEKGIKFGRLFAAMMRHAIKWWAGEIYDPVDRQHHLTAVMWNAMVLMELERTHPEMDDREPQNYPLKEKEDEEGDKVT